LDANHSTDPTLSEEIVAIVHEIVANKRYVLLENLLHIAKKQTGAERLALENVINKLIQDKVIVPGSRLVRQVLLRNDTRKNIYNLIKGFPGININSIKKTLTLGSNVVMWHLSVLLKFGCIQEVVYKTTSLFALPKLTAKEAILHSLLRKGLIRTILRQLEAGRKSLVDLEKETGEDKSKIFYNLRNLEEFRVITKVVAEGNLVNYTFNEESKVLYFSLKDVPVNLEI
jgi:predicted transcriptional regulator